MSDNDESMTELDFVLQAGRDGDVTLSTVFQVLLRTDIWVLLNREPKPELSTDEVRPLMTKTAEGNPALVMFTQKSLSVPNSEQFSEFQHPQQVPAARVIDGLSSRVALLINPGLDYGVSITAEGVVELRNKLGHGFLRNIPVQQAD